MRYLLLTVSLVVFNVLQAQWNWVEIPVNTSFHEVNFWEGGYGVVLGKGSVIRTYDGGVSWKVTEADILKDCISFSFPEPVTGYALLSGYEFVKTTDSGYTWNTYSIAEGERAQVLRALEMIDSDNGFAVGFWISPGGITGSLAYRTTDGMHWSDCCNELSGYLERVRFQDATKGFAANLEGDLFLTSDGGENWMDPGVNIGLEIRDVHFVDDHIGFLAASSFSGETTERAIMKSIDGGNSWSVIYQDTVPGDSRSYRRIWFEDALNGWIIGTWGLISRTCDGGLSWQDEDTGTNEFFYDFHFRDIGNGIVVGSKGSVLKLGDLSGFNERLSGRKNGLLVFPNPCHEKLFLSWHSSDPGKRELEIFDLNGKNIHSRSHYSERSGEYMVSVNTSGLPSGIYLLRIRDKGMVRTSRVVVIH